MIEAAITARETPQALPSATLLGTYLIVNVSVTASNGTNGAQAYTYGTFLSSHKSGRWSRMARGEVSPAKTISSEVPRFSVLVVSFAPLFRVSEGTDVALSIVHTFLQLSVVASLLHKVQDLLRQSLIGHGPRC